MNTDNTDRLVATADADETARQSSMERKTPIAQCMDGKRVLSRSEDDNIGSEDATKHAVADKKHQNEETPLGVISQEIRDEVYSLILRAYSQATELVKYECIIPEGFVKLQPQPLYKHAAKNILTPTSVAKEGALPAAASAILTSLGVVVDAPAFAVVLLSASGAVIGSYLQQKISKGQYDSFQQEELPLRMLSENDITVNLQTNTEQRDFLLESAKGDIDRLCSDISLFEKRSKDKHDIQIDRNFGEWAQEFLMYADANPDDRQLQFLRDQFVARLAQMKIHVYDKVVLNSEGEPNTPLPDYLIDSRKGENYEKVVRPAIYSDRSLLARGKIT